jgi:1-acyl-sn-glycerol-3-phosphate acyltransferase
MTAALHKVHQATPIVYEALRSVFRFVGWVLLKQEISGLENLPATGPFLIVCNHLSIVEPPLVFIHCPRQMVMFAADKWQSNPFTRWLAETVGVIWVARGEADMTAIKQSLGLLKKGQPMGLAPEGTRSRTGALIQGKTGAAYLADRSGVPIVPISIWGTEKFSSNYKRLRRTPVTMVVGKPFHLPPNGRAKGEVLDEYTDIIMCHLAAMLPPEYRGVYAKHPKLAEILHEVEHEGTRR